MKSFPDMEWGTAPADSFTMSLDSMKSLLARLGNPQDGRRTVHITGSKGKGSTSTFIASILRHAGQKTALYISPHLSDYRERIQIDSRLISEEEFAEEIERMRDAVEAEHGSGNGPIVNFGISTALFFQFAARQNVDWQVVEVGLGGRDDATNVMADKDLAVITPISVEHAAILGSTPAEIASHKAGIIVPGSVAVLAPQNDPAVKPVIEKRCRDVGADLADVRELYTYKFLELDTGKQRGMCRGAGRTIEFELSLLGRHQIVNATVAVAAADALKARGLKISDEEIAAGLAAARLPGRLEVVGRRPLVVLDCAHNGESARVLRQALQETFSFRNCVLVLGVNRDKDVAAILDELAPISSRLIATRSLNPRAADPEDIASRAIAFGKGERMVTGSVTEAVAAALDLASAEDLICVTGSLYVVAEAREKLLESPGKTLG